MRTLLGPCDCGYLKERSSRLARLSAACTELGRIRGGRSLRVLLLLLEPRITGIAAAGRGRRPIMGRGWIRAQRVRRFCSHGAHHAIHEPERHSLWNARCARLGFLT